MRNPRKLPLSLATAAVVLFAASTRGLPGPDQDLIPPKLPKEQRENLQRFLKDHEKPERYIPADAKLVDSQPTSAESSIKSTPDKPIKQSTVHIIPHRPVPGQAEVKQVDVYYYRPHPEKAKPGITVRHTVG